MKVKIHSRRGFNLVDFTLAVAFIAIATTALFLGAGGREAFWAPPALEKKQPVQTGVRPSDYGVLALMGVGSVLALILVKRYQKRNPPKE